MIGPQHGGMDVFYTLPASLDTKSGFHEATIERDAKAELLLLVTMAPGDWSHSVWACAEHPDVTYYEFHK